MTCQRCEQIQGANDDLALTLAEILGILATPSGTGVVSAADRDRYRRVLHDAEQVVYPSSRS